MLVMTEDESDVCAQVLRRIDMNTLRIRISTTPDKIERETLREDAFRHNPPGKVAH